MISKNMPKKLWRNQDISIFNQELNKSFQKLETVKNFTN